MKDLRTAVLAEDADSMWAGRSVALLDAIGGTGVEVGSGTLLDDMESVKADHPVVATFLTSLPGYPQNREKASEHLSYCAMLPRRILARALNP